MLSIATVQQPRLTQIGCAKHRTKVEPQLELHPRERCEQVSVTRVQMDFGNVTALNQTARFKGSLLTKKCPPDHPFAEEVQRIHTEWVVNQGLMSEETVTMLNFKNKWINCLHMCTPEEAAVIPNYCAFFTKLDDGAEKYIETGEISKLKAAFDNFDVLWARGLSADVVDIPGYPNYAELKSSILDIRSSILKKASSEQYIAFCKGVKSFHKGVLEQVALSKHEHKLTATTQRLNRAMNVAFAPTFEIVTIFQGVCLSREARQHPFFDRVYWTIASLGGLANDVISYPKETMEFSSDACSQYHNYISAVVPEVKDQTLQNAIENAFDVHNSELEEVLKLGSLMCRDEPEIYPFLESCLDLHSVWMYWCLESPRYLKYFKSAEFSETEAYRVQFTTTS